MKQFLLLSALTVFLRETVAAQAIEVRLREAATGKPVGGALVRLIGDRGVAVQALSSETGSLMLRALEAGNYRIKVDRIGWAGVMAGPYALLAGETIRRELLLASEQLTLPDLSVEGASRCDPIAQGGMLAAALWEEIRKALTASLLSSEAGLLPVHVREFSRDLNLAGQSVREYLVLSRVFQAHTYSALAPDVLARGGFVFPRGDRTMYAAPDARSLLSEEFVASHCFRAVPGPAPLVGLAFEPVRDRRVIDVRGTLWVSRATSELAFLEYRYTRLPDPLARADLGGRVAFRRLPSGAWIVSSWHIRRPHLLREEIIGAGNASRLRTKLVGYNDRGARVEVAVDSLGRATRAVLRGRIYDSIAEGGLRHAVVYLTGSPDSIVTDSLGRYELALPDSGFRSVAARHRLVGLLGRPASLSVRLIPGDTTEADFWVPSLQTFGRTLCGTTWMHSGLAGILIGSDSLPATGLDLRIAWRTPTNEAKEAHAESGERGVFAMCGDLPVRRALTLRVYDGKQPLAEFPVTLTGTGPVWVELEMPSGDRVKRGR